MIEVILIMLELKGKYNTAKVFTDNIEQEAIAQIIELCNQEFVKDSVIRIMPDVHSGAGCTIGTTMTIKDKIVPNLVGVDIGCGMHVTILKDTEIDLAMLDKIIYDYIPSGFDIRNKKHKYCKKIAISDLKCKNHVDINRAMLSIGTLGGGNHFIEMNRDEDGTMYLVIHSGSRHLGKQVAEYYQKLAIKALTDTKKQKEELIKRLKAEGRQQEIQAELNKIQPPKIKQDLAYVEGQNFDDYIHDMKIVQEFAVWNRKAMADEIITRLGLTVKDEFSTIHNYINTETMVLRKGAISAQKGEKVIIPINMRDGSIIAIGKGNEDWNCSAPHGAGRLMSRKKAKETLSLEEFAETMKDIYTTSVNQSTLDESPMAYKPIDEILENIKDTVEIHKIIKPIYNFKSGN